MALPTWQSARCHQLRRRNRDDPGARRFRVAFAGACFASPCGRPCRSAQYEALARRQAASWLAPWVTYMLPYAMLQIRYYVASDGREPFADWFAGLEVVARAKVTRAIARMEQGNLSNVKSVGEGVVEYRIDFGPGYR